MFYKSDNSEPSFRKTGNNHPHSSNKQHAYPQQRVKESEMIFGLHAVIEAIDAGRTIDKILIRRDLSSALAGQLTDRLQNLGDTAIQRVPMERLDQYTDKKHQGVIAFLSPVDFYRVEDIIQLTYEKGEVPLLLVLDGITDVRNFGAIARTAVCAGVHAIIVSTRGSAPVSGDAVKTSAGALHSIPICKTDNMQATLRYLHDAGLTVVAATEHADGLYTQAQLTQPLAIVLGNEEKGIYEKNLELCDLKVRIPLKGQIESLNVSVAAGILLYEVLRQRQ